MQGDPEAPEITVYGAFVANLMSIKDKLNSNYHGDRYLRAQLMTSIDIRTLHDFLMEKVPRGAQQCENRVPNKHSDSTRTAVPKSGYLTDATYN